MIRPRPVGAGTTTLFSVRTPTLPPATHTNSFALGGRDVLLVEPSTPYPDEQAAFIEWARALPSTGRTPVAILATHHHADHVGGADVFTRELALPLWAHVETASRMRAPVSRHLAEGDSIDLAGPTAERWRVLHTPGHAPGHLCLWNEEGRTLIVGDMVASVGTIVIDPTDGDMAAYIAQLERLAALDARVALPAHGDPIERPTAHFQHYIAHRRAREAKVLAAVPREPAARTPEEILPDAYDDVGRALWPIALLSLKAHLKKLVDDGLVRLDMRSETGARYSAVRANHDS